MTRVPILTEAVLRAWGTDDPRTLSALRAENQPARTFRAKMVERRALDAGWPVLWDQDAKKAATAALRRLEGITYNQTNGHQPGVRARYHRASRGTDEAANGVAIEPVLTIFDE